MSRPALPKPYYDAHGVRLYLGDSLELLGAMRANTFDALAADPPYSSGGLHASDRQAAPSKKYAQGGSRKFAGADFSGDTRDQRSQLAWMTLWLGRARRLLKAEAYAFVFCDWRQLPLTTDAVQAGGLTWRGVVPWDKGAASRAPHKGFMRHQAEYAVWATPGRVPKCGHGGPWPGVLRAGVNHRHKNHPTAKPVGMMAELLGPVKPGGRVLDPFAGGGATLAACVLTGRRAVGCEMDERWAEAAAERVEAAARGDLAGHLPASG